MKNYSFLVLFIFLMAGNVFAQPTFNNISNDITPDGMFDEIASSLGHKYRLADLNIQARRPLGGTYSIASVPTESCMAGYFHLFFTGSLFTSGAQSVQAQAVVCEVFTSISNFISSPLSGGTLAINVLVEDPTLATTVGEGVAFYYTANGPVNLTQGPIDGMVYQMIKSGVDPYTTFPIANFTTAVGSADFYHGAIRFSNTYNWNTNMAITNIGADEYDLYSVALHEATHMLGFNSMIGCSGAAQFPLQQYSRYDQFLQDYNNNPLLTTIVPGNCGTYNQIFNSAVTPSVSLSQTSCPVAPTPNQNITNCSVAAKYVSANVTATVYTPFIFELGSSLSHFEDMCSYGAFTSTCPVNPPGGYNDLYYVMSNSGNTGSCYVKRHWRDEEKNVLCDLGYTTGLVINSTAANATHTYAAVCAPTETIIAMNDGYSQVAGYTFTTSTTDAVIPLATILNNDLPATGLSVTCVSSIYGNATTTLGAINLSVTANLGAGVVVLKYYPQKGANEYGNAAYIFVYFLSASCSTVASCNMLPNGGFEELQSGSSCGSINAAGKVVLCGWEPYLYNSNTVLTSGCTNFFGDPSYNLGVNTFFMQNPINSFNGSSRVMALTTYSSYAGAIKNNLNTPMTQGNTYQFSFWAINPTDNSTVNVNPNSYDAIITIASYAIPAFPGFSPFPLGLDVLAQFTVNTSSTWSQFTNTFVYTNPQPGLALLINLEPAPVPLPTDTKVICAIDEVNLVPVPSPTFSIPQPTLCGNESISNLANFTSTVAAFNFSGTGVSYNGINYRFNSPPSLAPGSYPIAFNYTTAGGCSNTLWQVVEVNMPVNLNATGSASYCANNGGLATVTVAANISTSSLAITWQPGALSGASLNVTPSVTTIYTITSVGAGTLANICPATQTLQLNVSSNCCGTLALPGFTQTALTTNSLFFGPMIISNSFTVQPGVALDLYGTILVAKDVSITVAGGTTGGLVNIYNSHVYACGDDMWEGIVVKDGGSVSAYNNGYDNLIEDAKVAIEVSNSTTTTATTILYITNTTFNKNHIDIKLDNYQRSSNSYSSAFTMHSNVFTCRNFTFSSSVWPQTTGSSLNLRTANTPTTGLAPPYGLLSAPNATLKSPFAGQTSSIAIAVNSVGVTSGTVFYGIVLGSDASPTLFNLFDSHLNFIHAANSNLTLLNNVFQNTKVFPYNMPLYGITNPVGAISFEATGINNNRLNMYATTFNVGNRFWNCHRGVMAKDLYNLNIEKAIFRSTQSTTNTAFGPGNTGLLLTTNRAQYQVHRNEFTNVNTGINIPLTPGNFTAAVVCGTCIAPYGIYATNISIQENTLSAASGGTAYMNRAISITAPNQASWTVNNVTNIAPFTLGIIANYNLITDAYRGILVSGIQGWRTSVNSNHIRLREDQVFNAAQRGIELNNFNATPNSFAHITGNEVYSGGSSPNGQTLTSLVYCGNNMGPTQGQPYVTCNKLYDSYNGFVFDGQNQGTGWYGNEMANLYTGMALTNTGVIGPQGSSSFGMGNKWVGSWPPSNYGIYTYSSNAGFSPLYVIGTTTPSFPPNLDGNPFPDSYGFLGNIPNSNGGSTPSFDCGFPNAKPNNPIIPNPIYYTLDESYYIALTSLYRFLHLNDSTKNSDASLSGFYSSLSGSSVEDFVNIEHDLMAGNLGSAYSLISAISPTNGIESNYQLYYNLYYSYASNHFEPTGLADSTDLRNLIDLCPGTDGACVYQARALFNTVYREAVVHPLCSGSGARLAHYNSSIEDEIVNNITIYPNPATNKLTFKSDIENETLGIMITDLSGRTVIVKILKLNGFIVNLDLELMNGAYLVVVTRHDNTKLIKKLIIAK